MMASPKILVTHREVPHAGLDILKKSCQLVFVESVPPKRSEIIDKCKGVDGIFWANREPLNAEILDAAGPKLKAITTMTAELDFVDIPTLKSRRMPLGYTPLIEDSAVADVAIGLMIAAARRFHEGRMKIETGHWESWHLQWMLGQDIKGAKVGFFGFGGMGQAVAARLQGFEVEKIYYTSEKVEPDAKEYNAEKVEFNQLLETSDIIFITSPLTNNTKGKFNAEAFGKMKTKCILVNVSRGEIVDQNALHNALKTNKIFAAATDVTSPEPMSKTDKLLQLPNLIITPHLGAATQGTLNNMAVIAAHNVLQGIAGEHMFSPAYVLPDAKP